MRLDLGGKLAQLLSDLDCLFSLSNLDHAVRLFSELESDLEWPVLLRLSDSSTFKRHVPSLDPALVPVLRLLTRLITPREESYSQIQGGCPRPSR